jgi:glycosyltransferase involved in cell wall biosynthesis
VEPDEASLATALLEAIEHLPDAAAADACRVRAGNHSIERCAERYQALYREIGA